MTAAQGSNASRLLAQLATNLATSAALRAELTSTIHGVIVFDIDGERWTLDLREGHGSLQHEDGAATGDTATDATNATTDADATAAAAEAVEADLTLTMSGDTFVKLVSKKISSQQAFLTRKLKIKGSMGMAMKLQPVLDAAVEVPSKL
jgi:putative sterol carrier protein